MLMASPRTRVSHVLLAGAATVALGSASTRHQRHFSDPGSTPPKHL